MNFKKTLLSFFMLLLFAPSVMAVNNDNWNIDLLFGDDFFSSFAIANSTYKRIYDELMFENSPIDPHGQIGVEVMPLAQNYTLKVKISCDEIMTSTESSIEVKSLLKKFSFYPKLDYNWNALRNVSQTRPVTIKVTVWVNNKLVGTKMKTVSLQAINNCPYTCISKDNKIIDLNYMYAAYVNEDNPMINNVLLKEIFSQGVIKQIAGYQTGNITDVYKQVFSVWNMLQKRGISYSSLTASGNKDRLFPPIVYHQFVRTFEDALNGGQANCVDGTVMMASILYRMGIEPYIITTPSHCFLGYNLGNGNINFLETTMLGSSISDEDATFVKTTPIYDAALGLKFGRAYDCFIAATITGNMNYQKDSDKFNNYSKIIELSFVTRENRSDLVNKLQYQRFPVKKYKDRGLQSVFK